MTPDGTLHHLGMAVRSTLASRRQCAVLLGGLACTALVSPAWAAASAAAATGLGVAMATAGRGGKRRVAGDAQDAYVIGYALKDGAEIRLGRGEVERNFLVLGTTGSGKSESLMGLADAFLDKGSGMAFVDAKGDQALYGRIRGHMAHYGREDDVLLLDFMTGNLARRPGHTFNPFAQADRHQLFRLMGVISTEGEHDDLRSRGKFTNLLSAFSGILATLRDAGDLSLGPASIRDRLGLDALMRLADPDGPRTGLKPFLPGLRAYLASLEGYDEERGMAQPVTAIQEHENLVGPLRRTLDTFATVYGHIFETQAPDIDVREVGANRRVLVVLLPALEKSGDELAAMGKVVTAALESIEMRRADGVPLRGRAPFLIVLDEVGYYLTPGLAAVAARAPETGTCWVFASQDIPALKRMCERESGRLVETCETKLFMRTEEMEMTASLSVRVGGERSYRGVAEQMDVLDFKGMGAGEMYVLRPGLQAYARCPYREPRRIPHADRVVRQVHLAPSVTTVQGEAA